MVKGAQGKKALSFWPSENMRLACYGKCTRAGRDWYNLEVRRTYRALHQEKIELGKNKGKKVAEFIADGDRFENGDGTVWDYSDVKIIGGVKKTIHPKDGSRKYTTNIRQAIRKDLGMGGGDEKPPPTGNHWDGDYFSWYLHFIWPDFPNKKPMGRVHEQWAEDIDEDNLTLHLDPRDHYKTTFFSIGYAVYCICEQKYWPILIVSLSDLNAKNIYASIRRHLSQNERILSFYGYLINEKEPLTQNKLFLTYQNVGTKDAGLFCATFGSTKITGTHPKLAILDDIEDQSLTPANMAWAKHLIDAILLPALGMDGKLIIVGTIKGWTSANDIYIYCEEKGIFSVYKYPAIYLVDKDGKPLFDDNGERIHDMPSMADCTIDRKWHYLEDEFGNPVLTKLGNQRRRRITEITVKDAWRYKSIYPERYTVVDIVRKRIELRDVQKQSDDKFWSEYFLKPTDPKGKFFSVERLGYFPTPKYISVDDMIKSFRLHKRHMYLWVDPGGKKSHGCAISVCALEGNSFYVVDLRVVKAGLPKVAEEIAELILEYPIVMWGVEGNFDQTETYGNTLERELRYYMIKMDWTEHYLPVTIKQSKGEKMLRIRGGISYRLGLADTPLQFFVNQNARDYTQFITEFKEFGMPNPTYGDFDVLDSITCCDTNFLRFSGGFFWLSNQNNSRLNVIHNI